MADVSREVLLASSLGMAVVSREAPLCGFRAEASIMGNTSAYADTSGYDRWAPLSERIQGGMCRDRTLPTDIDGQLSSAGKYLNTET